MRDRRLAYDLALLAAALLAMLGVSVLVVRALSPQRREQRTEVEAPPPIMRLAERRLREAALKTLEPQLARGSGVSEAMDAIRLRVVTGLKQPPEDLQVLVLDSATVNAFTFPGGLVVVCAGLVRALDSADELAAVVAHEVAHVVHRDASRAIAWQLGLSAVLSVLGGREAEVLVQRVLSELITMRYSREVEQRADEAALGLLERADIDPAALAGAFSRLKREGGEGGARPKVLQYLESHPDLDARIQHARDTAAAAAGRRAGPWKPIDPQVWKRLRAAL